MGKDYDRRPFSMPVVKHNQNPISGGSTGYMITRAPWQTGSNKYYVIEKLIITNGAVAASGLPTTLNIWDQDLSNTGPVARGSSAGPLISLPIPMQTNLSGIGSANTAPAAITIGRDALPQEYFQGGITVIGWQGGAINISGVSVSVQLSAV